MPLDFMKPFQTKDGTPVRILTKSRNHSRFPIVALVPMSNGVEDVICYSEMGESQVRSLNDDLDLVNVPEKRTIYLVGYRKHNHFYHSVYNSKSEFQGALDSIKCNGGTLVLVKEITYIEGQEIDVPGATG